MEGHGHNPVSGVEGLLHAVSMVDVYVDVQHSLVVPGTEQSCNQSPANFVAAIQMRLWSVAFQVWTGEFIFKWHLQRIAKVPLSKFPPPQMLPQA